MPSSERAGPARADTVCIAQYLLMALAVCVQVLIQLFDESELES